MSHIDLNDHYIALESEAETIATNFPTNSSNHEREWRSNQSNRSRASLIYTTNRMIYFEYKVINCVPVTESSIVMTEWNELEIY